MKTDQLHWSDPSGWDRSADAGVADGAQVVLVFGGSGALRDPARLSEVAASYPHAELIGCSTSGEIRGTHVCDESIVATAIEFDFTSIRMAETVLTESSDSRKVGRELAEQLVDQSLVHVLVFSDGLVVNGSELTRGFVDALPEGIRITGGLAGDGTDFRETLIVSGTQAEPRRVIAMGLYGKRLRVGYGSLGGWDPFGPERLITRAQGNLLFELDGRSALGLYRKYLGEYADDLPASALLFPLSIRTTVDEPSVVRTVLSIDDDEGIMTFAGDLPEGSYARLMKANFERLIDGANDAAVAAYQSTDSTSPDLALLISCVGRKMVLRQRVEEEVESVRTVLGDRTTLSGFYSYGEIAPNAPGGCCELHNQTMTITTLTET
jgi:hypothetical protein